MVNELIVNLESRGSFPADFPKIISNEVVKGYGKHQQSLVKSPAKSWNFTDRKEYESFCFLVPQFGRILTQHS